MTTETLRELVSEDIEKALLGLSSMSGLVSEAEGMMLAELATQVGPPGVIVEIGSYTGKSTCFLAEASTEPVYAIDLWNLRLPGETKKRNKHKYAVNFESTKALETFTERTRKMKNVTAVRAESQQVAKVWNHKIGLLFIDGAHDFASVKADYEGFAPFLVRGGWLAMHDATPGSKVERVIEQVVVPSGLWGERRQVERLAVFQRLEV